MAAEIAPQLRLSLPDVWGRAAARSLRREALASLHFMPTHCGKMWSLESKRVVLYLSVADALSLSKRRAKVTVEQHVRYVTFGEVQLNVQESEGEIGTHVPRSLSEVFVSPYVFHLHSLDWCRSVRICSRAKLPPCKIAAVHAVGR